MKRDRQPPSFFLNGAIALVLMFLVTLTQAERWDGKLPITMVPGGTLPMLTVK